MSRKFRMSLLAACIAGGTLVTIPTGASAEPSDSSPASVRSEFTELELFNSPELMGQPEATASTPGTDLVSQTSTTLQAARFTVTCIIKAHDPHPSSGAGKRYVIFKSTVKCSGTGSFPPTVTVRVKGGLFYDYASKAGDTSNIHWVQAKSSSETRTVPVNGVTLRAPFYTPRNGRVGATGKGHFQETSTITIISPTGQKVGSSTSNVRWYNVG
ncbi:hypothetical protein ACFWEJ_00655 [Promicromonospora sp. NPDC060204]|uniref:hypothetical protein n=1 Tax=Promicromonospora sp. NPDC060204 TaxID=3347071 RepID=UPI0036639E00